MRHRIKVKNNWKKIKRKPRERKINKKYYPIKQPSGFTKEVSFISKDWVLKHISFTKLQMQKHISFQGKENLNIDKTRLISNRLPQTLQVPESLVIMTLYYMQE